VLVVLHASHDEATNDLAEADPLLLRLTLEFGDHVWLEQDVDGFFWHIGILAGSYRVVKREVPG
jgi:hypothetical protein